MKKLLIMISAIVVSFSLMGCNTIQGFGEDLSAGGKAVSRSAENVKTDISQND